MIQEQFPSREPVPHVVLAQYYELTTALLRASCQTEDEALQQTLGLHVQDPAAFEWHATKLEEYRIAQQVCSDLPAEDFMHQWVTRLNDEPASVLVELEKWRKANKQLRSELTISEKREIESIFPEEAMRHHTELMVALLVQKGLTYQQATFVMFMRRSIDESSFLEHSLNTATFRAETISRMIADGDSPKTAEELWSDWVQDEPDAVYLGAIDWLTSQDFSLDQSPAQPSS